jgi:hypothetical protein
MAEIAKNFVLLDMMEMLLLTSDDDALALGHVQVA